MNSNIHYFLGNELYEPEQLDEMFENTYKIKRKDMLMLSVSFSNLSSIFFNANEFILGKKFSKISNMFLELYYGDFYTKQSEKMQMQAIKSVKKCKKFIGFNTDCKAFCRNFSRLIEKTFTNIGYLDMVLPDFSDYDDLLFKIGYGTLNKEECKLLVKNFKNQCKDKPIYEYELNGYEKSHRR